MTHQIVVGVDGSPGASKALQWAVEEARLRQGAVEAVRAWTIGEFGTAQEHASYSLKAVEAEIAEVMDGKTDVKVTATAAEGHAGKVLLEHAKGADMLVVGSRGHGGFTGLLLGSVSQQVTTHAGSPVVVVIRD